MSLDRDRRVEEIFDQAVDLNGVERSEFLQRECGADQGLRQAVESLLDAYDRSPSYFERPVAAPVLGLMQQGRSRSWIGRQVGPFEIRDPIGDGGMGTVFVAEQQAPVRRRVALKVMNATFASEQMVRRFSAERQALALMNHPYIAQVYESGSTDDGEPWVAMEYIEGVAVNDYCDSRRLSVRQRLGLFLKVCGGVQHAHQKGIIHRDLKPSNVLVTGEGEGAMPKIIDFGIAKAIDQRLVDATLATGHWLMGTPSYMSPERFGPEGDVDTRADVYSLGVMLYELLVGELPFEREAADVLEIAAKIGSDEAERPSSRVTTVPAERLGTLADHRSTDAAGLARALEGDLDWICLKAMEADRERRYESASELAADIRRHLEDEPVVARPPSTGYRIGKFVRRHTVAVGAAAAVVVAVIAGVVGIAVQSQRANEQAERATEAGVRASEQQLRAEQVSQFLVELFQVSDPSEAKGNTITAREILDRGADKIASELEDEPEVQATLMDTMGVVYKSLGMYGRARALIERGLEIRRGAFGDIHRDVATSTNNLASTIRLQGDYALAEQLHRQDLAMRRELYGDEHRDVLESLNDLALVLSDQSKYEEAERLFREVLDVRRKHYGDELGDMATSVNNLALVLSDRGKLDESEHLQREALELTREAHGEDHPSVAIGLNNLAAVLVEAGKYSESERYQREALALRRKMLGDEHVGVATSLSNLATAVSQQGRLEEAELLLREALEVQERSLGAEHPRYAVMLGNLASLVSKQSKHGEAERLFRRALPLARKTLGERHPNVAICMSNMALAVSAQGRLDEAATLYRGAVDILSEVYGERHPHVAVASNSLAMVLFKQKKHHEAVELQRHALTSTRETLGERHPNTGSSTANLAAMLVELGAPDEAESLYHEAIAIYRESLPANDVRVATALLEFGELYLEGAKAAQAEPLLREAVEIHRASLANDDWRTAEAESALGASLTSLGRYEEAEELLIASASTLDDTRGRDSDEAIRARDRIVDLYDAWGRPQRAAEYRAARTGNNGPEGSK